MAINITHGDVLQWAAAYDGPPFHALICDPPYHLTSITELFGGDDAAPAAFGTDGAFARASRGFLGQTWDGGDVAFRPETWAALARHLYPGAFLMAFASSRGYHRMAVAIEDAGLRIHPSIFGWSYACLSEDSEVLTEYGWRTVDQLTGGERVAQWDPETGSITFVHVSHIHTAPYQGDMIAFRNRDTDQLLTPNHRVYKQHCGKPQRNGVREYRAWEPTWTVQQAGEINRWQALRLPLAGYHNGPGIGGEDYARLLGWVWTEGGFDHEFTGVRIYQSSVNPAEVVEIGRILAALEVPHRTYTRDREYRSRTYTEHMWFISGAWAERLRRDLPDKHPTWDLLWRMTQPEKLAFLDAAMAGDGSDSGAFYQKSPADREWWQVLLHLTGRKGYDNPHKACVGMSDSDTTELQGRHLQAVDRVPYSGIVWCVTVPSGAFMARRNGKIFITGNSGFPKATRIDSQIAADLFRAWLADHPEERDQLRALDLRARDLRRQRSAEAAAHQEHARAYRLELQTRAGVRTVIGQRPHAPKFAAAELGYREKDNGYNSRERETFDVLAPASDLADAWSGHRYGLQALKPALEPIIVAQKPYPRGGRPVDAITETGAGALWIDGGRIDVSDADRAAAAKSTRGASQHINFKAPHPGGEPVEYHPSGRWPANLALCHHPSCTDSACVEVCAVRALGAQSGESRSGQPTGVYGTYERGPQRNTWDLNSKTPNRAPIGDSGTAARCLFNADWTLDRLEAADAVVFVAKPSPAEKEAGLDPLQVRLMRELYGDDLPDFDDTTIDDGRETPIDNAYQRGETKRRNTHATIKPITLARHLATLLLPPERYGPRRLLIPFSGAGSEVVGALLAGWEDVEGIELEERHVQIARARVRYWSQRRHELDRGQPVRVRSPRQPRQAETASATQETLL